MADKPINQAPEQSDALYSVYARKNNTDNTLSQIPANQFAHAVGFDADDAGKVPYIDASGNYTTLAPGSDGHVIQYVDGLPVTAAPQFTDIQEFSASGTWTKDVAATFVLVRLWGAGGGGSTACGGGGGAYVERLFLASDLSGTETVTIGAGGDGAASGGTNSGTAGGNTTFGPHLTAYGGAGGVGNTNGGTGGGWLTGGAPNSVVQASGNNYWQLYGGGFPGAWSSVYGGGSGASSGGSTGGNSIFGGAGGGAAGSAGGTSTFGGPGGQGGTLSHGQQGSGPGGGGGSAASSSYEGGPGGAGRCEVFSW